MARILCVGNVTLDIINLVEHFPVEDAEVRTLSQSKRCGGNAANTALVLSQLAQDVYLSGVVANDDHGIWLKSHLRDHGVNVDHVRHHSGASPTSYITLSQKNGSRTIVHHRELDELSTSDFSHIALEQIDWFHFEGRNVETLGKLLRTTLRARVDQPISLEIEKHRSGLETLAVHADVIFFSRPYAVESGHTSPESFLSLKQEEYPKAILSLTWGEQGSWLAVSGHIHSIDPGPVGTVVDTIGAGDSYNAGFIDALVSGKPPVEAATQATRLAEKKIQIQGLTGLN